MQTTTIDIPAMDCPEEFVLVEKGLRDTAGVGQITPDYFNRRLRVEYDAARVSAEDVAQSIRRIGFPATCCGQADRPRQRSTAGPAIRRSVLAGGVLLAVAGAARLSAGQMQPWIVALAVASTVLSGLPVARSAWRALRLRTLDMNVLMSVAAIGATITGEYFEAATAMFLFGISLWLEGFSIGRARRAVRTLVELTPTVAHRLIDGDPSDAEADLLPGQLAARNNGHAEDVDPADLNVGDRVLVKPGERIPVDGQLLVGASTVNEAPITGESVPVDKSPGERLFAGSLNGEGSLQLEVTRPAAESTLAHIARLVEQAQATRSSTERFVDHFARRYTPAVIVLAVLLAAGPPLLAQLGVGWAAAVGTLGWFHRSLVLLVIACPCALVISTPVTIVCGLYAAARRGWLIKGGEHLENIARIDAVALDKTGTLTTGAPEVTRIDPADGASPETVLRIAAALESHSEHPLAEAITREARQRGVGFTPAEQFTAIRGFGIQGTIDGTEYFVGSGRLMAEHGVGATGQAAEVDTETDSDESAQTVALVGTRAALAGRVWLADPLRPEAREAIAGLHGLGVRSIVMLTGDRRAVARRIAAEAGIDEVRADLLPEDKVSEVQRLVARWPHLAMVGDGVNDAPALAAAKVGIALGSQASDTALETADVVVMNPRLTSIAGLIRLGRRTRQLLVQNIALALAIKGAVLLLAAVGVATLWMAVAADVGATMIVVANGMRLLRPPD